MDISIKVASRVSFIKQMYIPAAEPSPGSDWMKAIPSLDFLVEYVLYVN